MFRTKLLIGFVFIVAGIAWPTVSISRGLKTYSDAYRTAAREHRVVLASEKRKVIVAVEQGVASILAGLALGLFGLGLGLGSKRPAMRSLEDTPEPVNAGSLGVHISGGPTAGPASPIGPPRTAASPVDRR